MFWDQKNLEIQPSQNENVEETDLQPSPGLVQSNCEFSLFKILSQISEEVVKQSNPVCYSLQIKTALLIHHVLWCDLCIRIYAGECWPCSSSCQKYFPWGWTIIFMVLQSNYEVY